jgi:hypothetical protein
MKTVLKNTANEVLQAQAAYEMALNRFGLSYDQRRIMDALEPYLRAIVRDEMGKYFTPSSEKIVAEVLPLGGIK